jgi:hypothetical protein
MLTLGLFLTAPFSSLSIAFILEVAFGSQIFQNCGRGPRFIEVSRNTAVGTLTHLETLVRGAGDHGTTIGADRTTQDPLVMRPRDFVHLGQRRVRPEGPVVVRVSVRRHDLLVLGRPDQTRDLRRGREGRDSRSRRRGPV